MTYAEFDKLFEKRVEKSRSTLCEKAREYAVGGDRMHNFQVAARLRGTSVEDALWGMAVKHIVSVSDMIRSTVGGPDMPPTLEQWDEKLGDAINYLFLLDAVVQGEAQEWVNGEFGGIEGRDDEDVYPKGMAGFMGGK